MKLPALVLFASAAALALPAQADVFSMQGFSGETTTMDSLPGVNLDAVPGQSVLNNCTERDVSSTSYSDGFGRGTLTECRLGNFSVSTVRENPYGHGYDTTYGGNPPPWAQGWRP